LAAPRWPPILGSTSQIRTAEKAVFACRMRKKVGSISKQGSNLIIKKKSHMRKFCFSSTLNDLGDRCEPMIKKHSANETPHTLWSDGKCVNQTF